MGRKSEIEVPPAGRTTNFTMRLDRAVQDRLRDEAKARGILISDMIREIFRQYVDGELIHLRKMTAAELRKAASVVEAMDNLEAAKR
jgi:hypothetical protein